MPSPRLFVCKNFIEKFERNFPEMILVKKKVIVFISFLK